MSAADWFWILAALALAGLNLAIICRAPQRIRRRGEWFTKPAVMVVLIAWVLLQAGWEGHVRWVSLALTFSLIGDILLLFALRFFLPGLVSFLTAHVCYIIWLNPTAPPLSVEGIVLTVVLGAAVLPAFHILRQALLANPSQAKFVLPVQIYALVISLMALSALLTLTRPEWQTSAAVCTAAGGLLFFTSDFVLAYSQFAKPIRHRNLIVMLTYHLGQVGLAVGAILQTLHS